LLKPSPLKEGVSPVSGIKVTISKTDGIQKALDSAKKTSLILQHEAN